jgi:ADP-ribosylation factor-like protein 3
MIPVIVFANKQDLANSATAEQIATNLELNAIRDRPWFIQPCSVKQNNGIKEGMSWVMSQSEIRL